jgi:transcriptional regulator with XRE-family HTH domain
VAQTGEVDPLTQEVARQLTAAKNERGMSFTQLAEQSGFARSAVVNWLSGERSPTVRDLYQLCEVLGLDPREVIAGVPLVPSGQGSSDTTGTARSQASDHS